MTFFLQKISPSIFKELQSGKPLYMCGKYRPYFRDIDFPIEIREMLNMSSKYQIGDCVKLIHLVYPNTSYEGKDAIVTFVKLVQVMYGSFYTYTVSIDTGFGIEAIEDLLETNLELRAASEPTDIWPPPCSCETWKLATLGCECGAMIKEREMKEKGLVPNASI